MGRGTSLAWTPEATHVLVTLLLDEVRLGGRVGNNLTEQAKLRVVTNFNSRFTATVPLTVKRLKDKWNNARNCCQVLNGWFYKETGLSYDPSTRFVDAPDHFWTRIETTTKNPTVKKAVSALKNKSFLYGNTWSEIFGTSLSTQKEGFNQFSKNYEGPILERKNDEGPVDERWMDLHEESSGDSDEPEFGRDTQRLSSDRKRKSSGPDSTFSPGELSITQKTKKKKPATKASTFQSALAGIQDLRQAVMEFGTRPRDPDHLRGVALLAETSGLEFGTKMHFAAIRLLKDPCLVDHFNAAPNAAARYELVVAFMNGEI